MRGLFTGDYDPGTQVLIDDLLAKPESDERNALIADAQRLVFHDFKSTLDLPKHVLHTRLLRAGYADLARRSVDGRYDQEKEG